MIFNFVLYLCLVDPARMIRKPTEAEREAELEKKIAELRPPPYEPISDKLKEIRIDSRSLLAFAASQTDLKKDAGNKKKLKIKRKSQASPGKSKNEEEEYYEDATFLKPISSKKSSEASKRSKISTKINISKKPQIPYKHKNMTTRLKASDTLKKSDAQKMLISSSVSSISGDGRDNIDKPGDYMQSSQVFDNNDTQSKEKITQSFESEYLGAEEMQPILRELASSKASSEFSKKSSKKSDSKNAFEDAKQFTPDKITVIIADKKAASPVHVDNEQLDEEQSRINEQEQPVKIVKKAVVRKREEMPKERAKYLFEFVYGLQGIPKRIGSAHYLMPFKTDEKSNTPESNQQKVLLKSESFNRIPRETREMSNSKYFDDWLNKYEYHKMKATLRQTNASRQANLILKENLNRWSESISKKIVNSKPPSAQINKFKNSSPLLFRNEPVHETRPSISAGNRSADKENMGRIVERSVKSAYISAKLNDMNSIKRPKTVSFTVNSNKTPSMPDVVKEEKDEISKSITSVHVQPTYLVSQIEMEEILQESERRVKSVQSERSRMMQNNTSNATRDIRQKNISNVSFADIVEIDTDSDGDEYFRKFEKQHSAQRYQNALKPSSSMSTFRSTNIKSGSATTNAKSRSSSGYKSKTKSYNDFYDDSVISTSHR
jgi:hypothetical protein